MIDPDTIAALGLVLPALGAIATAKGVLISEALADQLSGTYWDQNVELKACLMSQSRWAAGGLCVVAIGTALQIIAITL